MSAPIATATLCCSWLSRWAKAWPAIPNRTAASSAVLPARSLCIRAKPSVLTKHCRWLRSRSTQASIYWRQCRKNKLHSPAVHRRVFYAANKKGRELVPPLFPPDVVLAVAGADASPQLCGGGPYPLVEAGGTPCRLV